MTTKDGSYGTSHVRFVDSDDVSDLTASLRLSSNPPPPPPMGSPPPNLPGTPMSKSPNLRGNLMRELTDRDPLFNYEVEKVVGVGSMGSVALVSKRASAIGGSARRELQKHFTRERRMRECANIPVFGNVFQFCLKGFFWQAPAEDTSILNASSGNSLTSSVINPKGNALEWVDEDDDDSKNKHKLLYAMKSIHLSRVTDPSFVEELRNEVRILRDVDHPHIVRPIETYEHRNQIFIIMELCSGGDLYSRDPYTEPEAARIVSSILSAISYMHNKNIVHRDLKYENIMFINDEPKAEIKLIDFGLSKKFGPDEDLTEGVGTIYTMAPEVLAGKYTKSADVWSIGVIAYMLLSSQMPFYGRKRKQIVESIMRGSFDFKGRRWKRLSPQSKDFVRSLLVVDPEDRYDADEALSAVWLNRRMTATVRNPYEEEIEGARHSMVKYAKYSKLKKMALMVVAHKSSTSEIGILRKIFQKYDTKKDGQLSYEEFRAALVDAGYAEKECEELFRSVDLDGTGTVRYTEFLAATIEAQGAISEERLAEAFDRIDEDDSGYISAANLKALLGNDFPQEEIDEIIREADLTKDGKISYSEFLALWEDKNETKHRNDIHEIQKLAGRHDSERSSLFSTSEEDSDADDAVDLPARINFLEEKRHSERKASVDGAHGTTSSSPRSKNGKHVGFISNVDTIPVVNSGKEERKAANDAVV